MCMKKCCANISAHCAGFYACEKRGIENIGNFFKTEHTPLENGLLVSTAVLGGIVLGILCTPNKSVQIGSSNGCANNISEAPKKCAK